VASHSKNVAQLALYSEQPFDNSVEKNALFGTPVCLKGISSRRLQTPHSG